MKPRKPRVHARSWFTGTLEHDELHARRARLRIDRGARRQKIDEEGNVISDLDERGAVLSANIGDRIMVFGPAIDEIATADVVTVYPSGDKVYIAIKAGEILPTTTSVKLLKLKKLGSAA